MNDDRQWLSDTCEKLRALFASMPDVEVRSYPLPLTWDPDSRLLTCAFDVRALDGGEPTAKDRCQEAVCRALEIVASGRLAFIRTAPEVNVNTNFETCRVTIQGYVRFSASPDEGSWKYAGRDQSVAIYTGFPR